MPYFTNDDDFNWDYGLVILTVLPDVWVVQMANGQKRLGRNKIHAVMIQFLMGSTFAQICMISYCFLH